MSRSSLNPSTQPVMVVAGGSAHYGIMSKYWFQYIPDEMKHRSIATSYYSNDLLKYAIDSYAGDSLLVHLGDAVDVGCLQEFNDFTQAMSGHRWVMAPGRHDGYFLGGEADIFSWQKACQSLAQGDSSGTLTKNHFIAEYLKTLRVQGEKDPETFGALRDLPTGSSIEPQGNWESKNPNSFLQRLTWRIDRSNPARSFILQEISLSLPSSSKRVHAILLDPVRPLPFPDIGPWTRKIATPFLNLIMKWFQPNNHDLVVQRWLDAAAQSETTIVLMARLAASDPSIKEAADEWMAHERTILYVSPKKGEGEYQYHKSGNSEWVELKTGYIGEWPSGLIVFTLAQDNNSSSILLRTSNSDLGYNWEHYATPECSLEWQDKSEGAYSSYESLMPTLLRKIFPRDKQLPVIFVQRAQLRVLQKLLNQNPTTEPSEVSDKKPARTEFTDETALAAIDALISQIPWDIEFTARQMRKLEEYERIREKQDPEEYSIYRTCQALWASKEDYQRYGRPTLKDNPSILLRSSGMLQK